MLDRLTISLHQHDGRAIERYRTDIEFRLKATGGRQHGKIIWMLVETLSYCSFTMAIVLDKIVE